MANTTQQAGRQYQRLEGPSYESLGMALPPQRVLEEFRSDKHTARKYEGLCYTPRNEKMIFEDLSGHHGTLVMVKHSPSHFRHLVRRQPYEFFIVKDAEAFTLEAISLIERVYRQQNRGIPPISVLGELGVAGWEMLYLLQKRMPLVVGEGRMNGDTEHITTGLEAFLK